MDEIFTSAKQKRPIKTDNEFYTYIGEEDYIDDHHNPRLHADDDRTLAKKIFRDDGSYKLMIKCDSYNKPCDPTNPVHPTNKTVTSYKRGYKFNSVNNKSFEYYVKFLQTRNKSWLLNTERELI